MIPVVFATGSETVVTRTGSTARVMKGSHWPASDPIVLARPGLFSADPRWGMLYSVEPEGYDAPIGDEDEEVESATAAPGERRSVRRR